MMQQLFPKNLKVDFQPQRNNLSERRVSAVSETGGRHRKGPPAHVPAGVGFVAGRRDEPEGRAPPTRRALLPGSARRVPRTRFGCPSGGYSASGASPPSARARSTRPGVRSSPAGSSSSTPNASMRARASSPRRRPSPRRRRARPREAPRTPRATRAPSAGPPQPAPTCAWARSRPSASAPCWPSRRTRRPPGGISWTRRAPARASWPRSARATARAAGRPVSPRSRPRPSPPSRLCRAGRRGARRRRRAGPCARRRRPSAPSSTRSPGAWSARCGTAATTPGAGAPPRAGASPPRWRPSMARARSRGRPRGAPC